MFRSYIYYIYLFFFVFFLPNFFGKTPCYLESYQKPSSTAKRRRSAEIVTSRTV